MTGYVLALFFAAAWAAQWYFSRRKQRIIDGLMLVIRNTTQAMDDWRG